VIYSLYVCMCVCVCVCVCVCACVLGTGLWEGKGCDKLAYGKHENILSKLVRRGKLSCFSLLLSSSANGSAKSRLRDLHRDIKVTPEQRARKEIWQRTKGYYVNSQLNFILKRTCTLNWGSEYVLMQETPETFNGKAGPCANEMFLDTYLITV